MKKSDELLQKRSEVVEQIRALDKVAGEKDLTEEQGKQFDELREQIKDLDRQIERAKFIEEEELREAERVAIQRKKDKVAAHKTPEERAKNEFSLLRAIKNAADGRSHDGAEREMYEEAEREARDAGVTPQGQVLVPSFMMRSEKRDMLSETTTAGGFTVQTDIGSLIPYLDPRTVIENLGATFIRGLSGNIDFPRNDAAATAAWEGETDANAETSPTFDRVQLSPERLGAFTDISKQVLVQSSIDMEAFVRNRLSQAIAEALDTAAINGSGSNDVPQGILGYSIGDVAGGSNGAVPSWDNIVELETDVATANADMGTLAYLTTPGIRGALKGVEKATNTAQFVWNDAQNGRSGEGVLNGYRALVSTLVPSTLDKGSSTGVCHAIIFGNWQELIVAQWAGLDLVVDPYSGAKNALVTLVANTWWDIALRHEASFSAMKDALTA